MSIYNLGLLLLRAQVDAGNGYEYFKAKLSENLFKDGEEKAVFKLVDEHFRKYNVLPDVTTVAAKFPEFATVPAVEPAAYYLDHLGKRFTYNTTKTAITTVQDVLNASKEDGDLALEHLKTAVKTITEQKFRRQILDFGVEAPQLLMTAYKDVHLSEAVLAGFGWPYMDQMTGGLSGSDVISFVGRPAMGKTWLMLYTALHNFKAKKMNTMFVSMEMNTLQVAQRAGAMYTHTSVKHLKAAQFSSPMLTKFKSGLQQLLTEEAHLYIIDGNLAVDLEEIYILAALLGCKVIVIDGAYLVRSANKKLDRFARVTENVEGMKRFSTDLDATTVASWQFNRDMTKKDQKKGQKVGTEDIGSSDAIGQVSSVVCGMLQSDGVETLNCREVTVLKGRNGETGKFSINWHFDVMNFDQVAEPQKGDDSDKELAHI